PVALRFETEYPGGTLPAVTDLAAGDAAIRIVTSLSAEGDRRSDRCPAVALVSPAAVGADVEAAPVVDRADHRGRLGIGPRGEVGGRCRSHAQRDKTDGTQQKLLHLISPVSLVRSVLRGSDLMKFP